MKKSTKWIIFLLLIALVGGSVFFVSEQLQRNAAANREEQLQWRLQIHLDEMGRSVERIDPIRPDNWPDVDTWQFAVTFVDEPELAHVFTEVDGGSGGWRLLSTEGEEGASGVEENDQSITEMPDAPLTDGRVEESPRCFILFYQMGRAFVLVKTIPTL